MSPARARARTTGAARPWCLLLALALLLGANGCADQQRRQAAAEAVANGRYEQALAVIEAAQREAPDSAAWRADLLRLRAESTQRLVGEAMTARAASRFDDAEQGLQRALALDPGNPRVLALLSELGGARRQQRAFEEAQALLDTGDTESALAGARLALKDPPAHPGLQLLTRRLEDERHEARRRSERPTLAEQRPISLDFRDASLRTVLDLVSRHSGVNFILDRDIRAEQRITVHLRQARVEDALDLIVATGQLAKKVIDAQTIVVYPNTPDKQRDYQEQVVRVFHLATADAKGAAAFLRTMLKLREPFVDERTNLLALRDSPENIELAERLVALYDAGEPEVLLDVEVIEVSASRLTELGIKFPDSFSLTPLAPAGASGLTLGNIESLTRDRVALGMSGLLLNLKREVGDFSTLANPRIRARNKEKGRILIGDKVPVITTTTGIGGFVSDSVNYLDVGLKLEVEPTVYPDDEVAIRVALEVSSLGPAVRTNSGTLAYQIGTRSASTLLRLRDGETQLLAGLISRDERSSASRVPGAGDLPVLGRLFSSQQDRGQRTELILAITPRVLRNVRRPSPDERELWVGTEAAPRLRRVVGAPQPAASAAASRAIPAVPATPASLAAATERGPALSPATTAPAAPTLPAATLLLNGPTTAAVGQPVALQVTVRGATGWRGLPLDIGFDPQQFEWVDATEGPFLGQDGSATSFARQVDGAAGRVRLAAMRRSATGVAGEGVVFTVRLRPLRPGPSTVRVDGAEPVGSDGPAARVPVLPSWTVEVR